MVRLSALVKRPRTRRLLAMLAETQRKSRKSRESKESSYGYSIGNTNGVDAIGVADVVGRGWNWRGGPGTDDTTEPCSGRCIQKTEVRREGKEGVSLFESRSSPYP